LGAKESELGSDTLHCYGKFHRNCYFPILPIIQAMNVAHQRVAGMIVKQKKIIDKMISLKTVRKQQIGTITNTDHDLSHNFSWNPFLASVFIHCQCRRERMADEEFGLEAILLLFFPP
jgi:hypothetical protein